MGHMIKLIYGLRSYDQIDIGHTPYQWLGCQDQNL